MKSQIKAERKVGRPKGPSLQERLEEGVYREPMSGCWLWEKPLSNHRYPRLKVEGKVLYVHRLSYKVYKGPIPRGLHVLHTCDIPSCCNPYHLVLGTHADNMRDKWAKGRAAPLPQPTGSAHPRSKLTELEASTIFQDQRSHHEIAVQFGVSVSTVRAIKGGRTWKHVERDVHIKTVPKAQQFNT